MTDTAVYSDNSTPQQMIVVYDPETGFPCYTVDPPYPPEFVDFHTQAAADNGKAVVLTAPCSIQDKCVLNGALTDRPSMALEGVKVRVPDEDYELGEQTAFRITGLLPNSTIFVDGLEYENGDDTEIEVILSTPGAYNITVVKAPYREATFTVTEHMS